MPKLKTHRGAKKRFRLTGKGKIKRNHAWKSHLLSGKSPARKRRLRKADYVDKSQEKNIKRLLPYS